MSKSGYLENAMLDAVLNNTALQVATPYVSLHTADPAEDGSGAECSGGSYARQAGSFGAASGGSCANDAEISFDFSGYGGQATVTHFGIWDAVSVGNLLYKGALTASKTVDPGDTVKFAVDQLTVTED